MHFLLDANVPRSAIELLRKFGHSCEHAGDVGFGHAADELIAKRAQEASALFS